MRELNFANADVRHFIERVKCCKFPYQSDARAEDIIHECGTRVFGCIMKVKEDFVDDAEGDKATRAKYTASKLSSPVVASNSFSRLSTATSMRSNVHPSPCVPFSYGNSENERKYTQSSTTIDAQQDVLLDNKHEMAAPWIRTFERAPLAVDHDSGNVKLLPVDCGEALLVRKHVPAALQSYAPTEDCHRPCRRRTEFA